MRLLLTRPRGESERLAKELSARDVECLIAPLMEIVPMALELSAEIHYQAVILTSGNAVEALVSSGLDPATPIFCVGDATARRLAHTDFSDVRSASGDAEDLVALICRDLVAGQDPILHLSGTMIATDIGSSVNDAGFRVDRRVVYRAQPVNAFTETTVEALGTGTVDGVLLYSPQSARLLVERLRQAALEAVTPEMTAYCLSRSVADAAEALTWRKVAVAPRPNQVDLLALLPN
ncbi:MAG: uroporphyrinogen-III synthase [Proteobacteria bacterium]|nr:uroporphyrinogen-III synthase [Pseudomonadota bacterium]